MLLQTTIVSVQQCFTHSKGDCKMQINVLTWYVELAIASVHAPQAKASDAAAAQEAKDALSVVQSKHDDHSNHL